MTWNEFCELYFDTAKKSAEINLKKLSAKLGQINPHVDLDYVRDTAVLSAMEKAYTHYDASRGAKITTYLSTLVHNEIVDTLEKESKAAAKQQDIDDVKTVVKSLAEEVSDGSDGYEARKKLLPRLRAAMDKLSPSDQIILFYYLEDQKSYVSKSVEALKVSENYVSVRRHRIFRLLPRLMEMTRAEYLRACYDTESLESGVFASYKSMVPGSKQLSTIREEAMSATRARRANPILPTLDTDLLAAMLCDECGF
jgi:DNA-directed RNA polymerase specialized sigma24 family protein